MNWFKFSFAGRLAVSVLLLTLFSACATRPPEVDINVTINFPDPAPIVALDQADKVLTDVALAKAQIDWRYRQKEQICFDRFWMNDCLHSATTERRTDLARVKKSEIEAQHFKRKNTVEDMDRSLYENNLPRK